MKKIICDDCQGKNINCWTCGGSGYLWVFTIHSANQVNETLENLQKRLDELEVKLRMLNESNLNIKE